MRTKVAASLALVFVLVVVLALAIVAGCESVERPTVAEPLNGWLEGTVTDGGGPFAEPVVIEIDCWSEDGVRTEIRTEADTLGHFRLPVPSGRLVIRARTECGTDLPFRFDPTEAGDPDTLRVANGTVRADLVGGRIGFELALPAELADRDFRVHLERLQGEMVRHLSGCSYRADQVLRGDFRLLPPGDYVVRLANVGEGDYWLPGTYLFAEADTFRVPAGGESRLDGAIPAAGILAGTVTGSWQLADWFAPEVSVYRDDIRIDRDQVDFAGRFALTLFESAAYRLRISIGGIGRWHGGADLESATVFDLEAGQSVDDIAIVDSGIRVRILPPWSLAGPGARYSIYDVAGRLLVSEYGVPRIGNDIVLSNLAPGDHFLEIRRNHSEQEWQRQFYDRARTLEDATPIAVPAGGGVAEIDVTLEQGGQLRGRVLDAAGQPPFPFAFVLKVHDNADSTAALFELDPINQYDRDTGDWAILGLPDGDYRLAVREHSSAPAVWYPGVQAFEDAATVTIEGAAEVTGLDWQLSW